MMWPKRKLLIFISLSILLVVFIFSSKKFNCFSDFKEKYSVYPVPIPEKLDFAGEVAPLEHFDVKEFLDRELQINTYWQSQTILLIKRTNRFFPEIEKILKEEGLPSDFKYLATAESGLTNTLSPSGAAGFWQFLKNTAKEYKLEINDEVDERYNLEKSTHAACRFLKDSYGVYGNWTLAAASFNIGRPELNRQLATQKENNYYNLILNEETARYIFRILAMKIIFENPDTYGFHIPGNCLYPVLNYKILRTDSCISDLASFAKTNGTNYKVLKIFNPWLRDSSLTNKLRLTYSIRIPVAGFRDSAYIKNE